MNTCGHCLQDLKDGEGKELEDRPGNYGVVCDACYEKFKELEQRMWQAFQKEWAKEQKREVTDDNV
jgi:hypothetical protein